METSDQKAEQIKEIYARYGLAMYMAQSVERGLEILLVTEYGPDRTKITRQQYKELKKALSQRTFGNLIKRLRDTVSIPTDFDAQLSEALNKRNWLAHKYFWDRAGHFMTDKGQNMMIEELQSITETLEQIDRQLAQIADAWMRRNGISVETLRKIQEYFIKMSENDL